jgi:hypothetical protein
MIVAVATGWIENTVSLRDAVHSTSSNRLLPKTDQNNVEQTQQGTSDASFNPAPHLIDGLPD